MKKDKQKRGVKPPDRVLFYLHGTRYFSRVPRDSLMQADRVFSDRRSAFFQFAFVLPGLHVFAFM